MRSITFDVTRSGGFHPTVHGLHATESAPARKSILHFNVLDDGTMVMLAHIHGDPGRTCQLIEQNPGVIEYSVSDEGDGTGLMYLHSRLPDQMRGIIRPLDEHEVFFESLEYVSEDEIRMTMIGETNEILQRALAEIPDEIDITVERIGAYSAGTNDLSGLLTDRQREILEIAMELGYYENPRRTTHSEIAKRVGIDASTVSEHMRKIEARAFDFLA
ncbi:helix-turn-helix domain-containing protein [Haladaptatus sp. DYF46]|uniref:helix-turn-helix domain-containing protein n=1 Tax=Haladaptatus sp. DYF46 TaxID=2886041 RepID=UPI001E5E6003|nr:helix-turn-helix domain-containing protein [Haladaptatus sp. DYF46]